ncbi:MAG: alpha/beta hydrolase [Oscillospiraceae bacterium]|jgi:pimeloyl-ACP methyl ester carboxylesterase|nr:alpha/beta hydrolase [Oscillospiraceae bacterium]
MKVYKSENAKKNILRTYDMLLEMWNVQKTEIDIPTTYGTTHVIMCGDENKPPLVLFHGVGDNSALMWLYNAKELSHHFRVFAIDTIGGPGKSCPNEKYNKDFDDIKWIDEVLMALTIDKINIAGTSNGAYLSQYYTLHRNEKVNKIVCMAGSIPISGSSPIKTMMKIFLPEALFPTKRNIDKLIQKMSGVNSAVFTDVPVIMEHYRWLLKGFNNMAMRHHKIINFTDEQVTALRDKALYLAGEADPFMVLGGKADLVQCKMNVQFFQDVGHGINHEISDEINSILIEYFK